MTVYSAAKSGSIPTAQAVGVPAPDFGHMSASGPGVFIDGWGAGPLILGKWRFEDSDRFGPALVNRDGELKANPYPGEQSPFWPIYYAWRQGGRRLCDDGVTCVWDAPKPTLYRRVGRRREVVVFGDEGGGYREVSQSTSPSTCGTEQSEVNSNTSAPAQEGGE